MAYEFLKKLFGESKEGEEPKKMSYEELEAAIDAGKIKVVDLSEGGYVSKDKLDLKIAELTGVKKQLEDANKQIKSFETEDGDVKQKVSEWEAKYNKDTQALKDQMAANDRKYAEEMFLSGYKFTSKAAKKGVLDEFRSKNFQIDNGKFLGGTEFMQSLMDDEDYKGAFATENKGNPEPKPEDKPAENLPRFSQGTNQTKGGESNPFLSVGFGFNRIRQPKEEK